VWSRVTVKRGQIRTRVQWEWECLLGGMLLLLSKTILCMSQFNWPLYNFMCTYVYRKIKTVCQSKLSWKSLLQLANTFGNIHATMIRCFLKAIAEDLSDFRPALSNFLKKCTCATLFLLPRYFELLFTPKWTTRKSFAVSISITFKLPLQWKLTIK